MRRFPVRTARSSSPDPGVDDGGDAVIHAIACAEWDVAADALVVTVEPALLLPQIAALEAELEGCDDYPGARSCALCRELVLDDFDHAACR